MDTNRNSLVVSASLRKKAPGKYRIYVVKTPERRSGWIALTEDGAGKTKLGLTARKSEAKIYEDMPEGHGSFGDWTRLFQEEKTFCEPDDKDLPSPGSGIRGSEILEDRRRASSVEERLASGEDDRIGDIRPPRFCKVPVDSGSYIINTRISSRSKAAIDDEKGQ